MLVYYLPLELDREVRKMCPTPQESLSNILQVTRKHINLTILQNLVMAMFLLCLINFIINSNVFFYIDQKSAFTRKCSKRQET